MTVRHIVQFRWRPEVTSAQIDDLEAGLADLRPRIPEIREYRYGRDLGLADGNADFAIVASFDDEAGYRGYAENAEHQAFIRDRIRPLLGERSAIQVGF